MDIEYILDKYSPKCMTQFLSNYSSKTSIKTFLNNDDQMLCILIGPNGGGKTTFIKIALEESKFNAFRPVYENYNCHKEFVFAIENFANTKSVFDKRTKIIFIDDFDVLITSNRYAQSFLIDFITNSKVKIILACNAFDEKKLTDFKKKNVSIIRLTNPNIKDCLSFFLHLLDEEGYEIDQSMLLDLIKTMNCNVRSIMMNIESFTSMSEQDILYQNYYDKTIFDIISSIFKRSDCGLLDLGIALSSDPMLISLIMYENYQSYMYDNYKIDKNAFRKDVQYVNSFYVSMAIIENEFYKINDWDMIENVNLIRCGSIRHIMNKNQNKKKNPDQSNISYTTILARSSQHYANLKKINKYKSSFDMNSDNFNILCEVIKSCKSQFTKCDNHAVFNIYNGNICFKTSK